jgi:hypothetical protein
MSNQNCTLPKYFFPGSNKGLSEFTKILETYAETGIPAIVFKLSVFQSADAGHFEYCLHGNGFDAVLLLHPDQFPDEEADGVISAMATLCVPLGAPERGTITDDGLKIPR